VASSQIPAIPSVVAIVAPALGGVSLGASFNWPEWSLLSIIGLAGMACALLARDTSVSITGTACGMLGMYLIGLLFLYQSGHREFRYLWPGLALALSLTSSIYVFPARALHQSLGWPLPLAFGTAWSALESVRSFLTVPFLAVPFPFLCVGATLHPLHYIIQIADIGGIPLVGFLLAGFAAQIAAVVVSTALCGFSRLNRRRTTTALLTVSLVSGYGFIRVHGLDTEQGPRAVLIAGMFPTDTSPADFRTLRLNGLPETDARNLRATGAIWIWSEMALDEIIGCEAGTECQMPDRVVNVNRFLKSTLVFGSARSDSRGARYNSLFLHTHDSSGGGFYDKHYIGPGDEFQPPVARWLSMAGITPLSPHTLGWPEISPGRDTPVFRTSALEGRSYDFAGTICFDIWHPRLFRQFLTTNTSRPEFIVNIADEVFTGDRFFSYKVWAFVNARFRAIECRRTIVRCCGDGFSAVVAPSGQVLAVQAGASTEKPVVVSRVPIAEAGTVYVRLGDILPLIAIGICCLSILLSHRVPLPTLPGSAPSAR